MVKKFKKALVALFCGMMAFTTVACTVITESSSDIMGSETGESSLIDSSIDSNLGGDSSSFGGDVTHPDADVENLKVKPDNIPLQLHYDEPAPFDNEGSAKATMMSGQDIGWQNWSLPIGNGYFGVNVFGRTETERIQITEKTLSNPWQYVKTENGTTSWPEIAGLNNFSETYIDFGHTQSAVTDYNRYLDIRTAISGVSYTYNGVQYSREYFTSYPDKALVIRLDAKGGDLAFTLRPTIPFEQSFMLFDGDGISKTGTVVSSVENGVGCIELSGKLGYYDVDFVGYYRVYTDGGRITADTVAHNYKDNDGTSKTDMDGVIKVSGAKSAYIVVTLGTDYELCEENFATGQYSHDKQTAKTNLDDAREKVSKYLSAITNEIKNKSYEEAYTYLKQRHLEDYKQLFDRVDLNLNCNTADYALTTDALLAKYNGGTHSSYLETLLFQYGRYLIIASSREGALPANLQGAWNCYNVPAWSSGYWSNINVQMNYWHAFSTNLAETFIPYVDYNRAYMSTAEKHANNVISSYNPELYGQDGGNGWTMSVAGNPFFVGSDRSCGNMGLITQVYYDYYQFTKDPAILEIVYDVLINAAKFVTKCVKNYDGKYLVEYCDSPEMYVNGVWYYTTGTTYAQTLAYLNNFAALECAKELGIDVSTNSQIAHEDRAILNTILNQLDKYDPINVGLSGQIKEFREEDYYGSLGNPNHRHISQLVGLFPGNLINSQTEAWIDAALVTLYGRQDGLVDWPNGSSNNNEASIVAWAWAHKQALFARAGEGDMAQQMLAGNLRNSTLQNLLMVCGKIFQIEASSGTTAAIAEMLLQSDEGVIELLPALPTNWSKGTYTGMVARGNFEVSASWENSVATKVNILSKVGGSVSVKYPSITGIKVYDSAGMNVEYEITGKNLITFDTNAGETYYLTGFEKVEQPEKPTNFDFERLSFSEFKLSWDSVDGAQKYNVYVAYENAPNYTFVGSTTETNYNLIAQAGFENVRKTFVVTAENENGVESKRAICYSNPINTAVEVDSVSWDVLEDGKLQAQITANDVAGLYRLYEMANGSLEYVLVVESETNIISTVYNSESTYAISAVSKYTNEESDLFVLTYGNVESNILKNKQFIPTKQAKTEVFENNQEKYGYQTLTDGAPFEQDAGRFLSVLGGGMNATVDLNAVYALNEIKLYVYGNIEYAGVFVKIELLYNGLWTTAISCDGEEAILNSFVNATKSYLKFDLNGAKANKIRIIVGGQAQKQVSLYEITCFGDLIADEKVEYTNLFSGKTFVASSDTANNVYNADYGYQKLTDGIIYEEFSGRYSSKQNGGKVEATINLERVYNISELKIYMYKDGLSKAGNGIQIQVLFGETWTTVVYCANNAEMAEYLVENKGGVGDWLVFDLGDVYAKQVKFTVFGNTDSGWVTYYEMECYGVASTAVEIYRKTATFVGGEGTNGIAPEQMKAYTGEAIKLPENTFEKFNSKFIGWSDGEKVYSVGDNYVLGSTDVEFTAVWEVVDPDLQQNVFAGKQFIGTPEANAQVLVATWFKGGGYEVLTDGQKDQDQVGRFSTTMALSSFMDATLTFDLKAYQLYELKFYIYDYKGTDSIETKKGSIGTDILIQVYREGKWIDVITCADNESLAKHLVVVEGANNDYLSFNLNGVIAERVRFYISASASSNGTTFQEIECVGKFSHEVVLENRTATFKGGEDATGEAPDSLTAKQYEHIVLPENTFEKFNSVFKGWSDGINVYNAGEMYVMGDADVEFTAVWEITDSNLIQNVFAGKQFIASAETANNVYSSSMGYQNLTDGVIYQESTGRYSSKKNGGKIEATIALDAIYDLSEFKIYMHKDGLNNAGTGIKIQVLFGGVWTEIISCDTAEELSEYFVKNNNGIGDWLVFNLGGVPAKQVKFIIPSHTSSGWITFYEIECSGRVSSAVEPDIEEPEIVQNIFAGKQFIGTAEANAEVLTASWFKGGGYEVLTDGIKDQEQVGRFSTLLNNTTAFMDATIDLGREHKLYDLKFYLYETSVNNTASKLATIGTDIIIQVFSNGEWHDVATCANSGETANYLVEVEGLNNDYLLFNLNGISAEKVRFYISKSASTNGITFQEVECSGFAE